MKEELAPSKNIRVRFAPSPTGWLHMGGVRTALINYLFAKNQKGVFVLRVEDTDLDRSNDTYLKAQLGDLQWLGFKWDEGPHPVTLEDQGSYGPYRQSQRLSLYQGYAQELIQSDKAYYCFLTDKEIEVMKERALKNKEPFRVESPYRNKSLEEAKERIKRGESAVVRFKVPKVKKNYVLKDIVRGEVCFPVDMVGDFILLRSSGLPVYNFSCAIDDYSMKISHVFRSEEHLANTLRQMMIFEAFGWPLPRYGHLSLILGEDRKKLSKRHGSVSCGEYKKQGYLPAALLNFLALMGWNPKTEQEIFSFSELVDSFSLQGLNPSPGVFDKKKLDWINGKHLKQMKVEDFLEKLKPFFRKEGLEFPQNPIWWEKAILNLKDTFSSLHEAVNVFRFLSDSFFEVHDTAREVLLWPSTSSVLGAWEGFLNSYPQEEITPEAFSQACKDIQKRTEVKGKLLFMPIRTAVLGRPQGIELKAVIPLISRKVLLKRVSILQKQQSHLTS